MPTALEVIHTTAEQIGGYYPGTTTSGGTSSTLVCSALANSIRASTEFANWWVLIESGVCAGQMGQLTNAPLTVASGTLTTATTFTATIASGVSFSLYDGSRLPPLRDGRLPGLLQIVNQAAERWWIEDTISVSGVTGQIHYTVDTTTYPWLTDDTRIIEIQYPTTASDDVPRVMSRSLWSWVADGETKKLRFPGAPFKTGETFTLKVNRPGNSRIKQSGVWTDQATQTAGATGITDEYLVDARFLRLMARALAFAALAEMGAPGQTVAEWLAKAQDAERRAVSLKQTRGARDANDGVISPRMAVLGGRRAGAIWRSGY